MTDATTMSDAPSWRDRVGGPNAITLTAWAWLVPWTAWVTAGFTPGALVDGVGPWLVVAAVAHLATGLVLLAARYTVLRPSGRASRPWTAVTTFALAGAVRGAPVGATSVGMGLAAAPVYGYRIPAGALLTAAWLVLVTVMVDATRRGNATLAELHRRRAELDRIRADAAAALRGWRREVTDRIRGAVDQAVEQVQRELAATSGAAAVADRQVLADPTDVAARLHAVVDEVVRPLSHDLDARTPSLSLTTADRGGVEHDGGVRRRDVRAWWRLLLDEATAVDPFARTLPVAVTGITGLPVLVRAAGPSWGPLLAVGLGTMVGLTYLLADRATRRWRRRAGSPARAVVAAVVWSAAGIAVATVVVSVPGLLDDGPHIFGAAVATVVAVSFIGAVYSAAGHHRTLAGHRLAATLAAMEAEVAHLRSLAALEQRRLAHLVHGEVQSRIVGLALRLEAGRVDGSEEEPDRLLAELRRTCWQALGAAPPAADPAAGLAAVVAVWRAAVEVELGLDDGAASLLAHDPVAADAVVTIVREGLSNAARHGRAGHVGVAVVTGPRSDEVTVRMHDDGRRPLQPGRRGLGSRILDIHARRWELVDAGGGTVLEATVAVHRPRLPVMDRAADRPAGAISVREPVSVLPG